MDKNSFFSRTRMRPVGAVAMTVFAVAALFQNCGTYAPNNNPLYAQSEASSCIGPTCVQDINYLSLYIGNADPVLITRTVERSVDLGGYCDPAGFPDSKIYVELKSGATSVIPPFQTTSKCDSNGRFRVLLELPATYNYNLAHSIILTFRAVDTAGNEYDHPTGVNRREVTLLTAP